MKFAEKAAAMVPSQATVMEKNDLSNGKKSITTNKGKMTSRKVVTANNAYKGFCCSAHKGLPLYDGNPWFLPAIQYFLTLKDWMKSHSSKSLPTLRTISLLVNAF